MSQYCVIKSVYGYRYPSECVAFHLVTSWLPGLLTLLLAYKINLLSVSVGIVVTLNQSSSLFDGLPVSRTVASALLFSVLGVSGISINTESRRFLKAKVLQKVMFLNSGGRLFNRFTALTVILFSFAFLT